VYHRLRVANRGGSAKETEEAVLVAVTKVSLGEIKKTVTLVGTAEPMTLVDVRSKVSGRIDLLGVEENDVVEAGKTVLAEIDRETYEAQLDQAKAAVKAAQGMAGSASAALVKAKKDRERASKLYEEGAIPERDEEAATAQYDVAVAQLKAAEAQVQQAEAAVKLAKIQYKESQVVAPIDGIVLKKHQDAGNMTAPTAPQGLFTIGEIRRLKCTANVSERYVGMLQAGETLVKVCPDAFPDANCRLPLTKISPIVDPMTRTSKIEVVVPNDDLKMKPGMFVRMIVTVDERKDTPVLPAEAVINIGTESSFVYVVDGGIACKRSVTVGLREGAIVEISDGLQADEKVVIKGQANLTDGSPIRLSLQGDSE